MIKLTLVGRGYPHPLEEAEEETVSGKEGRDESENPGQGREGDDPSQGRGQYHRQEASFRP